MSIFIKIKIFKSFTFCPNSPTAHQITCYLSSFLVTNYLSNMYLFSSKTKLVDVYVKLAHPIRYTCMKILFVARRTQIRIHYSL